MWQQWVVAIEYLPNGFFLFAIVIFGVNVTSGPVNAFIYYSQVSTAYANIAFAEDILKEQGNVTYSVKPVRVISSLYGIWNLKFFHDIPGFCLTKHISHLQGIALQYVIAVFPLFLVVVLYVCIQLHTHNFRPLVWCWKPFHKCFVYCKRGIHPETSVIDAFATVTLLSYVNITNKLLLFESLYNGSGKKISTVVRFQARSQFFRGQHLAFALLAILVFLLLLSHQQCCFCINIHSFRDASQDAD